MSPSLDGAMRFDEALPPALFDALATMAIELMLAHNPVGTFWQELAGSEITLVGAAANEIARMHPALRGFAGVEWWVRYKPIRAGMPLHFDKDEALARKGLTVHPALSSVLYLTDIGGPTIVAAPLANEERGGSQEGGWRAFISRPKRNSCLVFQGNLPHGVAADPLPPDDGAVAMRASLLMNWWPSPPASPNCGKPPPSAHRTCPVSASASVGASVPIDVVEVNDFAGVAGLLALETDESP